MLWNVSNTFENIQFIYMNNSKFTSFPSVPHNDELLRNKKQYFYFHKKNLKKFKKLCLLYKGLLLKSLQIPVIKKIKKNKSKKKHKSRPLKLKKLVLSPIIFFSLNFNFKSILVLKNILKKKTYIHTKLSLSRRKFYSDTARKKYKIFRKWKRDKLGRIRVRRHKISVSSQKRFNYKYYNTNLKIKVLKKYKFSKKKFSPSKFIFSAQLIAILSKKISKKKINQPFPEYFFSCPSYFVHTLWHKKKADFIKRNTKRIFYDCKRRKKQGFLRKTGPGFAKIFERRFWNTYGLFMQKKFGVKDFTKKIIEKRKLKKKNKYQKPTKPFFIKARELKKIQQTTQLTKTSLPQSGKISNSSTTNFFKNAFKKQSNKKFKDSSTKNSSTKTSTKTSEIFIAPKISQEKLTQNKKSFFSGNKNKNKNKNKFFNTSTSVSTSVLPKKKNTNITSTKIFSITRPKIHNFSEKNTNQNVKMNKIEGFKKKIKNSTKILKKGENKKKKSNLVKVNTPDGKFVFLTRPVEIIIKKKKSKILKFISKQLRKSIFYKHAFFSTRILIKLKNIFKYLNFIAYKRNIIDTLYKNRESLFMPNKMLKVFNSYKPLWYYMYKRQKKIAKKYKFKLFCKLNKSLTLLNPVRSSRGIFWKFFKLNIQKRSLNFYRRLKRNPRYFFKIRRKNPKLFCRFKQFKKIRHKRKKMFSLYLSKFHPFLKNRKISIETQSLFKSLKVIKMSLRRIKKNWTSFNTKVLLKIDKKLNLTENNKKLDFAITNFLWLNEKTYETYLLNFFFIQNKLLAERHAVIKKTFFFNFRNKRLKTYRNARQTHWKFFTTKTLKKRRYQNFLNFFLKKQKSLFYHIFTFFVFKFRLSYKFWVNFNFFYQTYYTVKQLQKQIFQIPIHTSFWDLIKKYDLFKQKINTKLSYWQNKRIQIKKTFWMQQKKKVPTFFKKKIFEVTGAYNSIQYDFITNYFTLIKTFRNETQTNLFIFKNKYLKLHGFKYNS